jgi:hypothetical protein
MESRLTIPYHNHKGTIGDYEVGALKRFPVGWITGYIFEGGSRWDDKQAAAAHARNRFVSVADEETDPQNLPELSAHRRHR